MSAFGLVIPIDPDGPSDHMLQPKRSARQIDLRVPSKWAFPDAPYAAVTCNGGHESTSW